MLFVKTRLGISKIHGIGLFAAGFIPKGTMVWKYVQGFDQRFSKEEIERLPTIVQNFLSKYTYLSKDTGFYVLCCDDARFYNHSKDPTTIGIDFEDTDGEGGDISVQDIYEGEEITSDYGKEWNEDTSSW